MDANLRVSESVDVPCRWGFRIRVFFRKTLQGRDNK